MSAEYQELKRVISSRDAKKIISACKAFLFKKPNMADFLCAERLFRKHQDHLAGFIDGYSRVAILGNCNTQALAAAIPTVMMSLGHRCSVYEAPYDTWMPKLLDGNSDYYKFKPDLTLLALTKAAYEFPPKFLKNAECRLMAKHAVEGLSSLWKHATNNGANLFIHHNLVVPGHAPQGRLENRYEWTEHKYAKLINEELWKHDGCGVRILDVTMLAAKFGVNNWLDPRWFYYSKHPFSPSFIANYAYALRGTITASLGISSKVLVIDLDDTLWGGTVGDVGPEGVVIGPGTAKGEAHWAFANYIKALKDRGVVLAVNSRNSKEIVEKTFSSQKHIPLKLHDFASVHCHWEAKSVHMYEIAKELNVGVDSLVFVDDDSFQCEEVRQNCPDAVVVNLPNDTSFYIPALDELFLFDQISFTEADALRVTSYKGSAQLHEMSGDSLDAYLEDTKMTGLCIPLHEGLLDRAEQLFLKTNQFNLTQIRFTREQLKAMLGSSQHLVLVCELEDRFTKYGVVSVLVAEIEKDCLNVKNWVMSCRVFSRTFENYILNRLSEFAGQHGLKCVAGRFFRTERNAYAADYLKSEKLTVGNEGDNTVLWSSVISRCFKTFVMSADA